jgi:Asp/Glu/hydantoin racemase
VIDPLVDIASGSSDFDALVIACYSDPGLKKCRSVTDKPVLGIQESALLLATSSASKFGVLALSDVSIARHMKYQAEVGVADRLAGECAVNLTVDQGVTDSRAFGLLYEAGQKLRDRDGADILILGCAGLAAHRSKLEDQLQIPVIDPTQAAVRQAVRLG